MLSLELTESVSGISVTRFISSYLNYRLTDFIDQRIFTPDCTTLKIRHVDIILNVEESFSGESLKDLISKDLKVYEVVIMSLAQLEYRGGVCVKDADILVTYYIQEARRQAA